MKCRADFVTNSSSTDYVLLHASTENGQILDKEIQGVKIPFPTCPKKTYYSSLYLETLDELFGFLNFVYFRDELEFTREMYLYIEGNTPADAAEYMDFAQYSQIHQEFEDPSGNVDSWRHFLAELKKSIQDIHQIQEISISSNDIYWGDHISLSINSESVSDEESGISITLDLKNRTVTYLERECTTLENDERIEHITRTIYDAATNTTRRQREGFD